jgi:hypothetical protein
MVLFSNGSTYLPISKSVSTCNDCTLKVESKKSLLQLGRLYLFVHLFWDKFKILEVHRFWDVVSRPDENIISSLSKIKG